VNGKTLIDDNMPGLSGLDVAKESILNH